MTSQRNPAVRFGYVLVGIAVLSVWFAAAPASASTRPVVSGLSTHHDAYWGGTRITVHGSNFTQVRTVLFGKVPGSWVYVGSPTTLTVVAPEHALGTVDVRVTTGTGTSAATSADRFTFTRPTMDTPIQGGLTAREEQRISSRVRAAHQGVRIAPGAGHWTPAMGLTAMRRARSWLGLPYSWAGGTYTGPTRGVCASDGGDLDCHVIGFDCSGLTLYAWGPYEHLAHFAATQHREAGRFHPTLGQLVPGDLLFFGEPGGPISHTVVYQGRGVVIQAPQSGYLVERTLLRYFLGDGAYHGATRPMSTGRQGSVPVVSAVTAELPAAGGYLKISGQHLGTTTSVQVGPERLYTYARRAAHTLVVKLGPNRPRTVWVTVSNPWGSVSRQLTFVGPPRLASLSPSAGSTTGGSVVTLSGANLAEVRAVTLDAAPVPFTVVSDHAVTVTVPAHTAGTARIVATSPFGTSNALTFRFVDAPASTTPPASTAPPPPAPAAPTP